MSNCFKIEKGVRQGCPLYPYLFVLFVEGLANTIRRDPSNKGISISQNELKLRQHADNNTLILHSSQDTLEASFDIIEKLKKNPKSYGKFLGLLSSSLHHGRLIDWQWRHLFRQVLPFSVLPGYLNKCFSYLVSGTLYHGACRALRGVQASPLKIHCVL